MVRDPHGYAATTRIPATSAGLSTFMILTNFGEWLVSSPIIPIFISADAETATAATAANITLFIASFSFLGSFTND